VTGADLRTTSDVEVLNAGVHIATVNSKGRLAIDVTVEQGKGYAPAERKQVAATIGVIPVDAIFSPVRRVAFVVEPTRVEVSTDFDRIVIDIETDGSISPREALASAGQTLRGLLSIVAQLAGEGRGLELGEVGIAVTGSPDLDLPIEDLDLPERPRNCLKRAQINTVGELIERSPEDLLAITNFGQKSLDEYSSASTSAGCRCARQASEMPATLRRAGVSRGRGAPEGHAGQSHRLAHRGRPAMDRHDRDQGEGDEAHSREAHHQGAKGRRPQPAPGRGFHP